MGIIPIRPLRTEGDIAYVPLNGGLYAIIDAKDAAMIGKHNWFANKTKSGTYARRIETNNGKRSYIYMHRAILRAQKGSEVDHADGNKLNNRRSNLRFCTREQNNANARIHRHNKSGIKGVYWLESDQRWIAQISIKNRSKYLGCSKSKEEAAEMYRAAAVRLHGSYARTS